MEEVSHKTWHLVGVGSSLVLGGRDLLGGLSVGTERGIFYCLLFDTMVEGHNCVRYEYNYPAP